MSVVLDNASVRAALMSRTKAAELARVDRRTIAMFEIGEQFVSEGRRTLLQRFYGKLRRIHSELVVERG